jgi:hypothetical protein
MVVDRMRVDISAGALLMETSENRMPNNIAKTK